MAHALTIQAPDDFVATAEVANAGLQWRAQALRLKLFLGELRIGTLSLAGLVSETQFSDVQGQTQIPAPPGHGFPAGVDVIGYRTFPSSCPLPRIAFLRGTVRYVPKRYLRHSIDLTCSFADYMDKFSSKSRGNRRREVRRFQEFSGGSIVWRDFKTPEEMREFHGFARQIARLTYQERLLKCSLPDDEQFVAQITDLARNGAARGFVLFHGSKPVSFIYCTIESGIVQYCDIGYDPGYQAWSPGTVLLYLTLERLFSEKRYRMFDFSDGEGPQKTIFASRTDWCADIFYLRPTARTLSIVLVHSAMWAVSRCGANLLRRFGILMQVKKILRRGLGRKIESPEPEVRGQLCTS